MTEQEWIDRQRKDQYSWATDDEWDCIMLLYDWERGFHHFTAKPKQCGVGVEYNCLDSISTFDFDKLTRLVFLAHDSCIRVEICASAPRRLRIILHKRRNRTGGEQWSRHPTLETAVERWRESHDV